MSKLIGCRVNIVQFPRYFTHKVQGNRFLKILMRRFGPTFMRWIYCQASINYMVLDRADLYHHAAVMLSPEKANEVVIQLFGINGPLCPMANGRRAV